MKRFSASWPLLACGYCGVIVASQYGLRAMGVPRPISSWAPPIVLGMAWMAYWERKDKELAKEIEEAQEEFIAAIEKRDEEIIRRLEPLGVFNEEPEAEAPETERSIGFKL